MARKRPNIIRRKTRKPSRKRYGKAKGRKTPANGYLRYIADAGVFCITLLIGCAALFAYIARDLPDTRTLWRDNAAPKVTLLNTKGAPIVIHGASLGAPIRLSELPDYIPQAILAVEDRNFYHHFGLNPVSVLRALIVNTREGGVVQGGSTITQQLAKNIFLNADRTIKRKTQEFILALWLEHKFTKDEILTLYLNRVYFGAGAYGIDAASHRYFAKPARSLSLGEAAVLAGLLKAPSRLAPTSNPEDAGRRGRLVVDQMVAAGFLSAVEAQEIVAKPIKLTTSSVYSAPYFVDHAMAQVRALVGDIDADLIVYTTLNPDMQGAAELGLISGVASVGDKLENAQNAVVILDGEGAVRAMIGGRDYSESQFNRAVQARRQPGSVFKPIVFLAGVENGLYADSIVEDVPVKIGKWIPANYKGKYYGEVTLREALARSLNSAAIRVQEYVGRSSVRKTAKAMGWPNDLTLGPALALGVDEISPMQLAGVYAPFANGGYRVAPHVIEKITTSDGVVIYQHSGGYVEQAAAKASINEVNSMLEGVVSWGSGQAAEVPGYKTAGKTGTTQDSRDAWFAGHVGGLVGVVWVGRDDNAAMPGISGSGAPSVIWREVMVRALPPKYIAPLQPIIDDPIAEMLQSGG